MSETPTWLHSEYEVACWWRGVDRLNLLPTKSSAHESATMSDNLWPLVHYDLNVFRELKKAYIANPKPHKGEDA